MKDRIIASGLGLALLVLGTMGLKNNYDDKNTIFKQHLSRQSVVSQETVRDSREFAAEQCHYDGLVPLVCIIGGSLGVGYGSVGGQRRKEKYKADSS